MVAAVPAMAVLSTRRAFGVAGISQTQRRRRNCAVHFSFQSLFWILLILTAVSFFWFGLRLAVDISLLSTATTYTKVLLLPPETSATERDPSWRLQELVVHKSEPSLLDATIRNDSEEEAVGQTKPLQNEGDNNADEIPHILVFTHKTNLLDRNKADPENAQRFLENIVHSIETYAQSSQAWHQPTDNNTSTSSSSQPIRVWFLDNDECERVLRHVYEPPSHADALVRYFRAEPAGPFRADLCRVAALYHTGGYYMDVDLKAIEPLRLPSLARFSTVIMLEGVSAYFQAFVAAAPQHPILMDSLRIMLRYYAKKDNNTALLKELKHNQTIRTAGAAVSNMIESGLIGPWSLKAAYEHRTRPGGDQNDDDNEDSVVFLAEELLHTPQRRHKFPNLKYQDNSAGCCCHYVVHDGHRPYFFSRFVGSGPYCDHAQRNDTAGLQKKPSLGSLWERVEQMNVSLIQFQDTR